LLIYYNTIAGEAGFFPFGKAWIENDYFTKWKMIHNLPLSLATFGPKPIEYFKAKNIDISENLFEQMN
jgi:hypothetical protein